MLLLSMSGHGLADAADCTAIDEPQARLDCYDRLHERNTDPAPAQQPQPRERSQPETTRQSPTTPQPADETVRAEVVATGEGPTRRRWFRLDSGELWSQVTPGQTDIEAGDDVRITRSPLGTYSLRRADGSSRSSKVRRLE